LAEAGIKCWADKAYQRAGRHIRVPFRGRLLKRWKRRRNSTRAKIRCVGEHAMATLKAWRLLRKIRCSTDRITAMVQAVLALHRTATCNRPNNGARYNPRRRMTRLLRLAGTAAIIAATAVTLRGPIGEVLFCTARAIRRPCWWRVRRTSSIEHGSPRRSPRGSRCIGCERGGPCTTIFHKVTSSGVAGEARSATAERVISFWTRAEAVTEWLMKYPGARCEGRTVALPGRNGRGAGQSFQVPAGTRKGTST
jgi:hypothetical protein